MSADIEVNSNVLVVNSSGNNYSIDTGSNVLVIEADNSTPAVVSDSILLVDFNNTKVVLDETTSVYLINEGRQGVDGIGVPTGGIAGQVLTKASGTDYDTEWQDSTGGIESVQAGTNISVDNTDPTNPVVSASGFATVATSGSYNDLSSKPTLGTAAAQNVGYFATAAQGALADTAVQPAALVNYVPISRTITINGDEQSLEDDRTWVIETSTVDIVAATYLGAL